MPPWVYTGICLFSLSDPITAQGVLRNQVKINPNLHFECHFYTMHVSGKGKTSHEIDVSLNWWSHEFTYYLNEGVINFWKGSQEIVKSFPAFLQKSDKSLLSGKNTYYPTNNMIIT